MTSNRRSPHHSSDDECLSNAILDKVNHSCSQYDIDKADAPLPLKIRLLGCFRIDRDSDYLEESSSSEPASNYSSTMHNPNSIRSNRGNSLRSNYGNSLRSNHANSSIKSNFTNSVRSQNNSIFHRKDSDRSTLSQQHVSSNRMNFSSSLTPLLSVEVHNSTSLASIDTTVRSIASVDTTVKEEDVLPNNNKIDSQVSLSHFSDKVDSLQTFPRTMSTTSFCNDELKKPEETNNKDTTSPSIADYTSLGDQTHDVIEENRSNNEEDDEGIRYMRVMIRLPAQDSLDSGDSYPSYPKPTVHMEPEDDMERLSQLHPDLVQRNESDSEDEGDVPIRAPPHRPSLPPPIRPVTGTPALARRTQNADPGKAAQQAKLAANAVNRVRKAKQMSRSKVNSRRQERRNDQKAAKTLTAILLAFIITWTPYNVISVVNVVCNGCIGEQYQSLYNIGELLAYDTQHTVPVSVQYR